MAVSKTVNAVIMIVITAVAPPYHTTFHILFHNLQHTRNYGGPTYSGTPGFLSKKCSLPERMHKRRNRSFFRRFKWQRRFL